MIVGKDFSCKIDEFYTFPLFFLIVLDTYQKFTFIKRPTEMLTKNIALYEKKNTVPVFC